MEPTPEKPTEPKEEKPGAYDPVADLGGIDFNKLTAEEAARLKAFRKEVEGGNADVCDELERASGDLDRLDKLLRTPRPNLDD